MRRRSSHNDLKLRYISSITSNGLASTVAPINCYNQGWRHLDAMLISFSKTAPAWGDRSSCICFTATTQRRNFPRTTLPHAPFHFDLSPSHVYLTDVADKWSVLPSLSAVPSVLSWVAPDHLLAFLSVFLLVAVPFFTLVQLPNIDANLLFDETLTVKKFLGLLQRKSYLFSFRFFLFLFLSFSSSCFCTLLSFPSLMEFVLSLLTSFHFWPSPCTRKEIHMAVS